VFVYLFTLVYLDYIKTQQTTKYVEFDVKTITAGDYTIEFPIELKMFKYWKAHFYDETNLLSENAQFRLYLVEELQERVSAIFDQGYEDNMSEEEKCKVSMVTMAYDNSFIIQKLEQRGVYIMKEDYKNLDKL
jgi:hypothetical protein